MGQERVAQNPKTSNKPFGKRKDRPKPSKTCGPSEFLLTHRLACCFLRGCCEQDLAKRAGFSDMDLEDLRLSRANVNKAGT